MEHFRCHMDMVIRTVTLCCRNHITPFGCIMFSLMCSNVTRKHKIDTHHISWTLHISFSWYFLSTFRMQVKKVARWIVPYLIWWIGLSLSANVRAWRFSRKTIWSSKVGFQLRKFSRWIVPLFNLKSIDVGNEFTCTINVSL